MTPEQEMRKEVLMQLYGANPLTLSPAQILREARRGGMESATSLDVAKALPVLLDGKFCEKEPDPATGETRYRITGQGILHWESIR